MDTPRATCKAEISDQTSAEDVATPLVRLLRFPGCGEVWETRFVDLVEEAEVQEILENNAGAFLVTDPERLGSPSRGGFAYSQGLLIP